MYLDVSSVAKLQETDMGLVFANVHRANEGTEKLPNLFEIRITDAGRTVNDKK